MSVYSSVRSDLRKSALAALSVEYPDSPVIFSHSNGAEPAESYVVVNILSIDQIGQGSRSTLTNEDEEAVFSATYEVFVQYSFCGSESGSMAHEFNHRINNDPATLLEHKRNNLGFMRKSQIRRAPQKRDTQWVEYHNIDVTYNYIVATKEVVDVVEAVVLQTELDGQLSETFSVPPGINI